MMWVVAEAVTALHRRALARLYSRHSAHAVPGEPLCGLNSKEGRPGDATSDEEVHCEGRSRTNLTSEVPPRVVPVSLPPVRLPQALEQAVKKVLAGK